MDPVKRVILIMIDGLRPDALMMAKAPNLHRAMQAGSSTLKARTVMPSVTLPCHTSLFYGVPPEFHGVTTNTWRPFARPVPGLIETVKRGAGGKTAMFHNWDQLRDLTPPGFLDAAHFINYKSMPGDESNQLTFKTAADWMGKNDFSFAFVYYGAVDVTGHEHGWMSDEYLARIADADRAVGPLLSHPPEDCRIIILADHGGHARTHGTDSADDITIPVITVGPGIPDGSNLAGAVSILDIAPTIVHWLGLTPPPEWDGKPLAVG
jgi:predicted AlkP superfamily pyrophosphatase or phosphodiesterase